MYQLKPIKNINKNFLRTKKFFDVDDFRCKDTEKIWWWHFKGKKNIGKTYWIINLMKKYDNIENKKKLALGRWSRTEMLELGKEFNESDLFPFSFREGRLYSKKTGLNKGRLFYIKGKGLNAFRSLQFQDYDKIIGDEIVPEEDEKEEYAGEFITTARKFVKFCSNVQRGQPYLEVYMFGNNNVSYDAFDQYFKVDIKEDFLMDKKGGIFYCNLRDLYIGVNKDSQVDRILNYDDKLQDFFNKNEHGELLHDFVSINILRECNLKYQFIWNEKIFQVYYLKNIPNKYVVHFSDKYFDKNYILIATKISDDTIFKESLYLCKKKDEYGIWETHNELFKTLHLMASNGLIQYTSKGTKKEFINMVQYNNV